MKMLFGFERLQITYAYGSVFLWAKAPISLKFQQRGGSHLLSGWGVPESDSLDGQHNTRTAK